MKTGIEIIELSNGNKKFFGQVDNSREITAKAVLFINKNYILSYQIEKIPSPHIKDNEDVLSDLEGYLQKPDLICFIAIIDGKATGQIMLKKYWNNFSSIEDIRVSREYRRCGVGQELMQKAVEWTKSKGLKGIRLETQDTNVDACQFYQSCGFTLEGFDKSLYAGFGNDETALYWYLFLD